EFTEFGSGFRVAMRDLEIRGAGNVLGAEQHGHLSTVGYDLYCKMVEDTMRELRGEASIENVETRMELHVSAYLPMDYVSGDYQRIEVYKKISQVASRSDWEDVIEELTDRFGDPTRPVMNLIAISYMRKMCEKLWIDTVSSRSGFITLKFLPNAQVDIVDLLARIDKLNGQIKFVGGANPALVINEGKQSDEDFLNKAIVLLEKLVNAPE
ncbi:MAG: TRCF domain-containing protein, partial [Christensenellales bacterium]